MYIYIYIYSFFHSIRQGASVFTRVSSSLRSSSNQGLLSFVPSSSSYLLPFAMRCHASVQHVHYAASPPCELGESLMDGVNLDKRIVHAMGPSQVIWRSYQTASIVGQVTVGSKASDPHLAVRFDSRCPKRKRVKFQESCGCKAPGNHRASAFPPH